MDIKYDYSRLPTLVSSLPLPTLNRLHDLLIKIETGHQLNPRGTTVIPFNSRVEEELVFLYENVLFHNTDYIFTSSAICNGDQCFLDLHKPQIDILTQFHDLIKIRIKTLTPSLNSLQKNTLVIYDNGRIDYLSYTRELIQNFLKKRTNEYQILYYMAQRKDKELTFPELAKQLKPTRNGGEDATPESRVRNTLQAIRKKLKLTKTNNDIFEIRNSIKLTCNVVFQ